MGIKKARLSPTFSLILSHSNLYFIFSNTSKHKIPTQQPNIFSNPNNFSNWRLATLLEGVGRLENNPSVPNLSKINYGGIKS